MQPRPLFTKKTFVGCAKGENVCCRNKMFLKGIKTVSLFLESKKLFPQHMFHVRANGEALKKPCFRRNVSEKNVPPFLEALKLLLIVSFTGNQI